MQGIKYTFTPFVHLERQSVCILIGHLLPISLHIQAGIIFERLQSSLGIWGIEGKGEVVGWFWDPPWIAKPMEAQAPYIK